MTVEVGHQRVALDVRALVRHGAELDRVLRLEVHGDRARRLDVRQLLRNNKTIYRQSGSAKASKLKIGNIFSSPNNKLKAQQQTMYRQSGSAKASKLKKLGNIFSPPNNKHTIVEQRPCYAPEAPRGNYVADPNCTLLRA